MQFNLLARTPLVGGPTDPGVDFARGLLARVFGPPSSRPFAIRFWDGSFESPAESPRFTLVLRTPRALRRMLFHATERTIGESYVANEIDVEGDFEAAAGFLTGVANRRPPLRPSLTLLLGLRHLRGAGAPLEAPRSYPRTDHKHSRSRDAAAIRYHYDLGNDFYGLWLDRRMVYSCAYFPAGTEHLDEAQEAKLDLICRKLRLRPGERFLDIGCGWGALVIHAAQRYGVHATGITLSRQQLELGRQRIAASGVGSHCHMHLCDYRELPRVEFDKIASIGMVEHVGRGMLRAYFRHVGDHLAPGGLFLNHGIVTLSSPQSPVRRWLDRRMRAWTSFIDAYVFPDGELVTPAEMIDPATTAGLEIRDIENLREHYALTLRHWLRRLEERREDALALAGEATCRTWRAYLAGSAHAFSSGVIGVIQALFARPAGDGSVRLPLTRSDLYERP